MKRTGKKSMALAVVLAMGMTLFAGCGNSDTTVSSGGGG